jgi:hypothetical protein
MTRLVCALTATAAVLLAGPTWKDEATTLIVAIRPLAMAKSYSPFQKAGCLLAGRHCGVGFHFVCGLPPNPERRSVIACPVSMRP